MVDTAFYRITYALVWILPAVGLWIAIRDRARALLDVSLAMALATLMTNKAYLGKERETWDPILFGALLIGIALILERRLASGPDGSRRGFTASRLLISDKEKIAAVGMASAAFQPGPATHAKRAPDDTFNGGGGRSGGGGASGGF